MDKIAWTHQILVSNFLSALPMETGMKIWTTSAINAITLATIGVGKGIGKVAESMTQAKLSAKFGETVINNIKNVGGFSTNEINSKIKQLNKLGMTQTTIDTLVKNPKFMFLSDDVITTISKLDSKTISRLFDISSENNINDWANLIIKNNGLTCKEVNIIGVTQHNLNTELDEVDFVNNIIYEDKNASGLYMDNPDVPQTETTWAQKQI